MPSEAWPETRAAFDAYWEASLAEVSIDPPVADYLMRLTTLQNLPRPARWAGSFNVFVTTGFLPPLFREQLGLPWSPAQQRRFDRLVRRLGRVERACPTRVRTLPFTLLLADLRRRIRRGKPLV